MREEATKAVTAIGQVHDFVGRRRKRAGVGQPCGQAQRTRLQALAQVPQLSLKMRVVIDLLAARLPAVMG